MSAQAVFASCDGVWKAGASAGAQGLSIFFHDETMPLFALTAYAKAERADLTQQDRNDFKRLTTLLVEAVKRSRP